MDNNLRYSLKIDISLCHNLGSNNLLKFAFSSIVSITDKVYSSFILPKKYSKKYPESPLIYISFIILAYFYDISENIMISIININ